jgi:GxxExxY protein
MELEHGGHRGTTEESRSGVSGAVIGAAMKVHSALGPGLLESVYEICLCHELFKAGMPFRRQVPVPVAYDGVQLDCGFRADLIVADDLVVEIKAVERFMAVHECQLLTYLRLTGCRVGLLLNFHTSHLRRGIKRLVL